MAITVNGVLNALPVDMLPIGYILPNPSTFADYQYRYDVVIPLTVSGEVDNTANGTMVNIFQSLNGEIQSILAADFLASATVTAYGVATDISTRYTPSNNDTSMAYLLSGTTNQYLLTTTIFVKSV